MCIAGSYGGPFEVYRWVQVAACCLYPQNGNNLLHECKNYLRVSKPPNCKKRRGLAVRLKNLF